MLFVALSFLIITNLATYFYLQKTKAQNLIFAERIKNLDSDLISQNKKLKTLEEDNNDLRNFKGRYEHAQTEINGLYKEKDKYLEQINSLNYKILEFNKQSELLNQDVKRLEKEKLEWEKSRAAVLAQLSEDLIKKNHEQQLKLTSSNQENIAKITENLFKDFENVITKITNLDEKVAKSEEISAQIKNALLTPKAAGDISEITLENILKASGLKEKDSRDGVGDYILQSHFSTANQEGKRPDAILFLPDNNIVIIDSKSSSHFIDLFEARKQKDAELEKNILAKLKESMRKHAESLKKRNYAKF
ncbi:MAG: DNA recombination protein RmuC, partial [Proteobacteria bacterium]|nr:DNA recombination protein RmuC [Pseudomonadota bacterium]